jgi:hypothetical protein
LGQWLKKREENRREKGLKRETEGRSMVVDGLIMFNLLGGFNVSYPELLLMTGWIEYQTDS